MAVELDYEGRGSSIVSFLLQFSNEKRLMEEVDDC